MKTLRMFASSVFAMLAAVSVPAFAAIDTATSTELSTAKADVLLIGALVFGIAIAVALYKWFKRAL